MTRLFISPRLPQRCLSPVFLLGLIVTPVTMAAAATGLVSQAIAAPAAVHIAQATTRPTLRMGSTGSAVSEIQAMLALLGYFNDPVDGQYQTSTEAAIQAFQTDAGLNSDGIVGPATWEALLPSPSTEFTPPDVPATATGDAEDATDTPDAPVALPTLRIGMTGPAVSRVQETLDSRGFYEGAIDGIFGPATEAAVQDFQASVELVADGVVGPATWQALLQ